MFKKALWVLVPLSTLVGPVAFYSARGWWPNITNSLSRSSPGESTAEAAPGGPAVAGIDAALPARESSLQGLEGASVEDLTEVFRFDVTPGWVVARWPRVSTGMAQLQLQGYRVPLVTGSAVDDLAGALTYYFNPRQELQRLTFHGSTGDPQKLVQMVTARYGLVRRLTNDPGMFLYERLERDGHSSSFLWIRPVPVVKASDPYRRLEVALLLERPEAG